MPGGKAAARRWNSPTGTGATVNSPGSGRNVPATGRLRAMRLGNRPMYTGPQPGASTTPETIAVESAVASMDDVVGHRRPQFGQPAELLRIDADQFGNRVENVPRLSNPTSLQISVTREVGGEQQVLGPVETQRGAELGGRDADRVAEDPVEVERAVGGEVGEVAQGHRGRRDRGA